MDHFIYEIFKNIPRLGPGSDESTRKAYNTLPPMNEQATILDIGCGTGSQTLELARISPCRIVALDNHRPYLLELKRQVTLLNLNERIHAIAGDMTHLPFSDAKFEVIWSEGAIYNMGFREGILDWKKFLINKGFLVVSEICWKKASPPKDLVGFWKEEYPGMKDIETNLRYIEEAGLKSWRYFISPDSDWWKDFYFPLEERLKKLIQKHKNDMAKMALLNMVMKEIDLFRKYSSYYGYVFFIMQKK